MNVRRAYCDTTAGQVHYRSCGDGTPLVLLHWAPASGRMYEHLLPVFAARGYRAIAPDLAGYGRSDKRDADWSIADYARNLGEVLRAVDAWPAAVVGGHISAAIATELTIAEPAGVTRLVLDGSPAWTAAQKATLLGHFTGLSPTFSAAGSHRTYAWDMVERLLAQWDDRFQVSADTLPVMYAYLCDYLETGLAPKRALGAYGMLERLALIARPVLALSADTEALRCTHAAVMGGVRDVREHVFPGAHPLLDPARAEEYAGVIDRYLRS
ncbi:MAG: Haloalkane dehalogenase [Steroidobacteraceae bacterium]|nr:Haloalkane dehalogenase [Steroidobacteraceae bacterium]